MNINIFKVNHKLNNKRTKFYSCLKKAMPLHKTTDDLNLKCMNNLLNLVEAKMKKLLNILIFSILLINPVFAGNADIGSSINLLKEELKKNNLEEELKELKELVTFIALKQIKFENQLKPLSINASGEKQNKAIQIIKMSFSKILSTGSFVLDKADKIISKKTFLALCLLLGPAVYISPKAIPVIIKFITKTFGNGAVLIADKAMDGAIEVFKENPVIISKAVGINLAIKAAETGTMVATAVITTKVVENVVVPVVAGAFKASPKFLLALGTFSENVITAILSNPIVLLALFPIPMSI